MTANISNSGRALFLATVFATSVSFVPAGAPLAEPPLGLPPVPVPENNPQSPEKIALGEKLFNETRFSTTGEVSCATCHDPAKAFTDSPRQTSEGIEGKTGTRNAPTVVNAAYMTTQFWDGREPDLEGQSKGPFVNPVEMGQPNHDPIIEVIRGDADYLAAFKAVFAIEAEAITIDHVSMAIASFERTVVSGNSPFDRIVYGGANPAEVMGGSPEAAARGNELFFGKARCNSCHTATSINATFTDGRFHNLNVSFDKIAGAVDELTAAYDAKRAEGTDIDVDVLTNVDISELGRFAVSGEMTDIGAFKTPTLRNVAETAPYMHDGSLKTLADVVDFYNNGGRVKEDDPVNPFQSGGIRPLNLTDQEKADLVAFLKTLTSPEYATDASK